MTTRAVVVGTDGTVHSDEALRFAAREAQLRGAELILVISYAGPVDPDVDDFETPKSTQIRLHEAAAHDALARALGVPVSGLPAHRVVCDDLEPSALLLLTSAHANTELIVIGQRQRHMLDRLVHGPSRAGSLARHSHLPVAVVPEPGTAQAWTG